jgi:branched-chain amino acid transport system substrate-binding protein
MLHANLLTRGLGAVAPVAAAALVLALAGCNKEEPKPADAPAAAVAPAPDPGPLTVKIGLAAPLTGSQAHIGQDIKDGAQLGVDDLNAQNPEVGGRKVKFELVAEDDEADPTKAANVAHRSWSTPRWSR